MTVQIGNKIMALRLAKSMTQEQLAGKLMVSPQAVSKWETGAAMPDIQLLPELSVALGAHHRRAFFHDGRKPHGAH